MASIRCAWGHVHATVAEVRACAAAHRDEPSEREGPVEDVPSDTEGPEPGVVVAGPDWLGRDAIISAGQDIPAPWTSAMRVVVDDGLRSRLHADPASVLGPIWTRRHARLRTVFVLDA